MNQTVELTFRQLWSDFTVVTDDKIMDEKRGESNLISALWSSESPESVDSLNWWWQTWVQSIYFRLFLSVKVVHFFEAKQCGIWGSLGIYTRCPWTWSSLLPLSSLESLGISLSSTVTRSWSTSLRGVAMIKWNHTVFYQFTDLIDCLWHTLIFVSLKKKKLPVKTNFWV